MPTERTQQELPFDRGRRLRLLERCRLPRPPKEARTSAATCLAVLRELDNMIGLKDGFRVRHEVLAERLGMSQSAVKRGLRYLRRLGVVDADRTGRSNWHTIAWHVVEQLATDATTCAPAAPSPIRQVAPVATAAASRDAGPDGARAPATVQNASIRAPSDGALCPIRSRTVPHQMAHCAPSTIPPTLPRSSTAAPYSPGDVADASPRPNVTWGAAAEFLNRQERLGGCGMRRAQDAVRLAQQRELSPADLLTLANEWRANRSKFASPGAILYRIENDEWPADGITTPRAVAEAEQAREARRRQLADEARRHEADRTAWLDECRALESQYGAELSALDDAEVAELARAAIERTPGAFFFDRWRADWQRPASSTRYALLCEIHHNRHFLEAQPCKTN